MTALGGVGSLVKSHCPKDPFTCCTCLPGLLWPRLVSQVCAPKSSQKRLLMRSASPSRYRLGPTAPSSLPSTAHGEGPPVLFQLCDDRQPPLSSVPSPDPSLGPGSPSLSPTRQGKGLFMWGCWPSSHPSQNQEACQREEAARALMEGSSRNYGEIGGMKVTTHHH